MSETLYQYHLKGKGRGFSGRGVRVRELGVDDVQRAKYIAAGDMGAKGSGAELMLRADDACIRMMIAEVTTKAGLDTLQGASWTKVTEEQLVGDGEFSFAKLFKPADLSLLRRLYINICGVSEDDIEAIVGGQLTVSAG